MRFEEFCTTSSRCQRAVPAYLVDNELGRECGFDDQKKLKVRRKDQEEKFDDLPNTHWLPSRISLGERNDQLRLRVDHAARSAPSAAAYTRPSCPSCSPQHGSLTYESARNHTCAAGGPQMLFPSQFARPTATHLPVSVVPFLIESTSEAPA